MGVIWDQYDTYVCHMTLSRDSHMGNTYVLHIINLPDTDVWQTQMYMTFATLKSHGKSHMCHMSLRYVTRILHSHIRHMYISHMGVISDQSDIYMCATWLCHMIVIWETHMCYILSTYLTEIWLMQMHMTFATWKSYGTSHMCHMSSSYLTLILHSNIRPI